MKAGMTLTDLATELERQNGSKRDFVAANAALEMIPRVNDVEIRLNGRGEFQLTELAHDQVAAYTDIPRAYYNRVRSSDPSLLSLNVNHWLHETTKRGDRVATINDRRMLRTLDGKARAFLSEKYRPLDNYDLGTAVLPVLVGDRDNMRIESCALTEQRMYIKAVTKRLEADVKVNDPVQAGVVISNSEVGLGMVKIEP